MGGWRVYVKGNFNKKVIMFLFIVKLYIYYKLIVNKM